MYLVTAPGGRKASIAATAAGDAALLGMAENTTPKRDPYVEGNLKLLDTVECKNEVMCMRYSSDGGLLAVGLIDGTIKLISGDSLQYVYSLSDEDTGQSRLPVTSIRFVPFIDQDKIEHKHMLVATYASGKIKFWHYTSQKCVQTINDQRQTLTMAFNPQGSSFITAGEDPRLNLYDYETRKIVRTMEPSDSRDMMNGHRARVFAVQYHALQPHMFLTGGWDDTIQFWDDRQKHSFRRIYGPHICGDALDIDPVHSHILTGSWRKDRVLQIWDFNSGAKIKDVPQSNLQGSLLYCAQWLGREHIVCGGCEQNMLRVIDRGTLNTVGQLVDLPNAVFCLDNNHQSKFTLAASSANKVYFMKLEKKI